MAEVAHIQVYNELGWLKFNSLPLLACILQPELLASVWLQCITKEEFLDDLVVEPNVVVQLGIHKQRKWCHLACCILPVKLEGKWYALQPGLLKHRKYDNRLLIQSYSHVKMVWVVVSSAFLVTTT